MFYRNKIRFLTKTKNISSLFLPIILILSFLLIIFNKTDYFVINKIKSSSIDIITPSIAILNVPVKITANIVNSINDIRFLKQENLKLKEEVLRLNKWQTLALKNERENQAYKKLLNSTTSYINIIKTASVISKTSSIYGKTIVINAGISQGVKEDLAVINERGLVGKVISISDNYSKVILINDQNSSIPVKTTSNNIFAVIKGSANGKFLKSLFIKGEKKPKIGDFLITSGSAKIFPQDLLVGKVIEVNENNFIALPYVDFDNLNFVQVVETN